MPPAFSGRVFSVLQSLSRVLLGPEALREFPLEKKDLRPTLSFIWERSSQPVRWFSFFAVWFFEWSALWPYFCPFSRLSVEKQERHFQRWKKSRLYIRYALLRILQTHVYTAFYAERNVASSLGFEEVKRGVGAIHELPLPLPATSIETEICVIGSGAGGAVVAKELAEKGKDVLILEEGSSFNQKDFNELSTLERNRLIYRDGGVFATIGFPMILLPTGKCVGGTTLINSGTCFRTPEKVLNSWGPHLAKTLAPYFEKVEQTLKISSVNSAVLGGNDRLVMKGAASLGLHAAPLIRNAHDCKGSGVCIFGCPTGAKQSMERSYLPLAFKAGARLISNCHVTKLVWKGERVVKIEAIHNGQKLTILPQKVVVSCGTLQTPLLLAKSGIGRESGQLGKNLSIHPTAKMVALFDETVDGFRGVPQASMISDFEKEGIFYESVFFPPWLLASSLHSSQKEHWEIMRNYRKIAIYGFLVHDESRGRVMAGRGGRPIVIYNLGKKEKELFIKGLRVLARLFFAAGARKVYPTVRTIPVIESADHIDRLISPNLHRRDFESAAFHPLGTCRMGSDPRQSVVDEQLRVHGMENLWVADGSVFPSSLGVNPQITIMAFAARCADSIASESFPR